MNKVFLTTLFVLLSMCLAEEARVSLDANMRLTPHGWRPAQCLHMIEENNHLIRNIRGSNPGVLVEYPDSKRSIFYPQLAECVENAKQIRLEWQGEHEIAESDMTQSAKMDKKKQGRGNINNNNSNNNNNSSKRTVGALPTGHVMYGYYEPDEYIGSMWADYEIPRELPTSSDQLLYFYIGIKNKNDPNYETTILQPVLAYCPSGDCGESWTTPGWSGSAWNCCPSGTTWYTQAIAINATIQHRAVTFIAVDTKGGNATVSLSWRDNATSTVQTVNVQIWDEYKNWNYAMFAMDAYDIKECDNLNSETFWFEQLIIQSSKGSTWWPEWTLVNQLKDYCDSDIDYWTHGEDNQHSWVTGNGETNANLNLNSNSDKNGTQKDSQSV